MTVTHGFPEECKCACHTNEHVRHIMACCQTCPQCGTRIKHWAYVRHTERCRKKFEDAMVEVLGRPLTDEDRKAIAEFEAKQLRERFSKGG